MLPISFSTVLKCLRFLITSCLLLGVSCHPSLADKELPGRDGTIGSRAVEHLNRYANINKDCCFFKLVSMGNAQKLKSRATNLAGVRLDPDYSSSGRAKYVPKASSLIGYPGGNYIVVLNDPAQQLAAGPEADLDESCWHELLHALEDDAGDIQGKESPDFAERHVDFMIQAYGKFSASLRALERAAREPRTPGSIDKMRLIWASLEKSYKTSIPSSGKADLEKFFSYSGCKFSLPEVEKNYRTDKSCVNIPDEVFDPFLGHWKGAKGLNLLIKPLNKDEFILTYTKLGGGLLKSSAPLNVPIGRFHKTSPLQAEGSYLNYAETDCPNLKPMGTRATLHLEVIQKGSGTEMKLLCKSRGHYYNTKPCGWEVKAGTWDREESWTR